MKKFFLFTFLVTGLQINFAQENTCVKDAMTALSTCLTDNNIVFNYTESGNTVYIYASGNPPPGQIQSCIAHYNTLTNDCPEAPVVVNGSGHGSYNSPPNPNHP